MKQNLKLKCSKKKITVAAFIIGIGVIGSFAMMNVISTKASEKETEITLETIPLAKQDLQKTISVTGTIASNQMKVITSEVTDTKIMEIKVSVGDLVQKGDVIAILDTSNLEIKRKASETTLQTAKQKAQIELNSAKRNMSQVEVTRDVELEKENKAVGDAYKEYTDAITKRDNTNQLYQNAIKIRKDYEIACTNAKSNQDSTAKDTESKRKAQEAAQNNYDMVAEEYDSASKTTVSDNSMTQSTLDTLKKKKEDALIALNNAKSAYGSTNIGTTNVEADKATKEAALAQAKADESGKEAEYKAALANVDAMAKAYDKAVQAGKDASRTNEKAVADQQDNVKSAQLNTDSSNHSQEEIELKKTKEQMEACVIKAPFDGIVTSLPLQVGDIYKSGEIATIQDTSDYQVVAAVGQYDISDITKNMRAIIKTETTGELSMNGMVTFVSPVPKSSNTSGTNTTTSSTNTSSNDYEIKVAMEQPNDRLRIGMTAKTSLIINEIKDAFVVPYYCVETKEDGSYYIKIEEETKKGEKPIEKNVVVKKVMETDYYAAIEGTDLKEGMKVIVPEVETTQTTQTTNSSTDIMY